MRTACFTGHRKVLGEYYNPGGNCTPGWSAVWHKLANVIMGLIESKGTQTFITGMAIGVDQVAAEAVVHTREKLGRDDIILIAAIPFPSQPSNWPQSSQDHYQKILQCCYHKYYISDDPYSPEKMHIRDRWMVDNSDFTIAVWDGRAKGGTHVTRSYALSQNKPVLTINPTDLTSEWSHL